MGLRLADHIDPRLVLADLDVASMDGLFAAVGRAVGAAWPRVDGPELHARLMERERVGSTALGGGLALPHASAEGLPGSLCVLVRPARPLPAGSAGSPPVDLVFVLLSLPGDGGLHMRLLARLARLCAAPGLLDRLRSSPDGDSMRWALVEEDGRYPRRAPRTNLLGSGEWASPGRDG